MKQLLRHFGVEPEELSSFCNDNYRAPEFVFGAYDYYLYRSDSVAMNGVFFLTMMMKRVTV